MNSITYLGLLISTKKLHAVDYHSVLHKIMKLLDDWKAKLLSFEGRYQLIKFSIWNYISYWLRGTSIPKACTKQIEKWCVKFLYHGKQNNHKLCPVS